MTAKRVKPQVKPHDLAERGAALFAKVTGQYVLNPAETSLLVELCRTTDELDVLTAAMAGQLPVVTGSTGQPRPHPLLAEIRAHRKLAEALAGALALPVNGETVGRRRSTAARAAANARWHRDRGA